MKVTALYAGLIAVLLVVLAVRVIQARVSSRVGIGDGGDATLIRRMRVHANCAEYAPIALILIGILESLQSPSLLLHGLGIALVTGRVLHAYGVSQTNEVLQLRQAGMVLTFSVILIGAVACLWRGLMG